MLSLTGALLAVFVPTFLKKVHTSKIAEATEQLEALHRRTAAYYEREHVRAQGALRGCLPNAAGPYPEAPSDKPVSVDFLADPLGRDTWRTLGLTQPQKLRYRYQLEVAEPGCSARKTRSAVTFRAEGDLDADGTLSILERTSVTEPERLVPQGPLHVVNRVE